VEFFSSAAQARAFDYICCRYGDRKAEARGKETEAIGIENSMMWR